MTASNEQPRGRPWLQFTLRSLLVVVAIVASFLAGRASMMRAVQEARDEATLQRQRAEQNLEMAQKAIDAYYVERSENRTKNDLGR